MVDLVFQFKLDEAAEEFGQAAALDSTFALSHCQLAYMLAWGNMDDAKEPLRKAMQNLI